MPRRTSNDALSPENRTSGSNRIHFAVAFRHPDSNFDPDFFIARLHINIADKIQSLRQCSGGRLCVWPQMLRRSIPDGEVWGSAGSIKIPCGGLVR